MQTVDPAEQKSDKRSGRFQLVLAAYLSLGILASLGLLGKLSILSRVIRIPVGVLAPLVAGWVCLPLLWKYALRWRTFVAPVVLLGVIVSCTVIFPRMADLKKTGRGTDQPDCVIVAAQGLASRSWPYDHTRMWSRTPMSCGPGWVLMQTPAIVLLGYRWNLLMLWALSLLLLRTQLQPRVISGFLSLMGLAVVTWVTASNGTDFLPFGLIVAGLMVALSQRTRLDLLWLVLLVMVAQFRFPMLILPVLLLPVWRLRQSIVVSTVAFLCQAGFLLWHPLLFVSDGPLHLFSKLLGERILSGARWTVLMEVTLIFAAMLAGAVVARRLVTKHWLALSYLYVLAAGPALLDLHAKYLQYHSLSDAFGIWEGVSWLSGCLPLAAVCLVLSMDQKDLDAQPAETHKSAVPALGNDLLLVKDAQSH